MKLAVWHAELGEPFDPSAVGMASRELRWGFHDWLRRGLRGDAVVADPVSDPGRVTAAYRLARLAWERDPSWATGYALLRTFGANAVRFHAADGAGYAFLAKQIRALDGRNPQVASRLARCFDRWKKFDSQRQEHSRKALESLRDHPGLSRDVAEIVTRALA